MSADSVTPVLEARGVGKRYGDAVVLDDVDLVLRAGAVHGLIGRNGAGKSTIVGILTGRHAADSGQLFVDGQEVAFGSPHAAVAHGVVAVPQEIVLPMDMSVTEVVTLGAEPSRAGVVRRRQERVDVRTVLGSLGLDIDIDAAVGTLPVSWQKVVMVAQALHRSARVIALDEPTSAMNADDALRVEQLVHALRGRGVAVLYISHRFEEVERLCDEVTVLRDGRRVAVLTGEEIGQHRMVEVMMGEDGAVPVAGHGRADRPIVPRRADGEHLRLDGVASGLLRDFELDVAPGALVGVAGLPGSGVEDVFATVSGTRRAHAGHVRVGDRMITSIRSAVRAGVASLPASRRSVILADDGVVDNMVLGSLGASARGSILTRARARSFCLDVAERLSVTPVLSKQMGQLSGGNQQRALVGGRLLTRPRFLVLEDPTVGVDIAARSQLHDLLRSLAVDGIGSVIGSSDPKELAELCDTVVVVRAGLVAATLTGDALTEYGITQAMTAGLPVPAA